MTLDHALTVLGLKMKQLVVLDLKFPEPSLKEFASAYPHRYVHAPAREGLVAAMAAGMASLGKVVLILNAAPDVGAIPDATLNVKWVQRSASASWDTLETELRRFGTGVLLIPEED